MEFKVIILAALFVSCSATYNTLGSYTGTYGLGYSGASPYISPVTVLKSPIPYSLPQLGYNYNSLPASKTIYSYPLDLDNFYDSGAQVVLDPGYGASSFIEKGLYSGNLNYGYGSGVPTTYVLGNQGFLKK